MMGDVASARQLAFSGSELWMPRGGPHTNIGARSLGGPKKSSVPGPSSWAAPVHKEGPLQRSSGSQATFFKVKTSELKTDPFPF